MQFDKRQFLTLLGASAMAHWPDRALGLPSVLLPAEEGASGLPSGYVVEAPPVPAGAAVTLTTPLGRIRGMESNGIRYFRGIPFARPPVGPLRFRPTQPVEPWRGILDATRNPPAAPQAERVAEAPLTSEDCLYLNIWAPAAPGPHPVYVYVHGGGNASGYSLEHRVDGANFARDNIVCVNVGYRLGLLGFVELGDVLGPEFAGSGNNGLRDILEALRWVQRCIADFGGDPSNITLGGQSAGAFNVIALCSAPAAQGLFQRAISQSGSGHGLATPQQAALKTGAILREAQTLGLGNLPNAPIDSLMALQAKTVAFGSANGVIDGDFLPGHPYEMSKWMSIKGRSLLIGFDREELSLFGDVDPSSFNAADRSAFASYREAFPGGSGHRDALRFKSAMTFGVPSVLFADEFCRAGGKVRFYEWNWAADSGPLAGNAFHGIEQPFVWGNPRSIAFRGVRPAASHVPLARRVHERWSSFIRSGAPAAPASPDWPEWSLPQRDVLRIDSTDSVGRSSHASAWYAGHIPV